MHIHLDAVGGVAGDMFVAAMLDACPELAPRVMRDLAAVLPAAAGNAVLASVEVNAIRASHFSLLPSAIAAIAPRPDATYSALVARIADAALPPDTAEVARSLLTLLAERESVIHGVPLHAVHFHEIADWDSLADMVAAASIVSALRNATWSVSELPLGGGVVKTAHGLLPVPAPATLALLEGFAWRDDGETGERVTPTGAAIIRHLVVPGSSHPGGTLIASGSGAGTRRFASLPNILRASLFEAPATSTTTDRVCVISFEVDDMTGEEIGSATARLQAVPGVLDVSLATRRGKKNRPMEEFRILARPEAEESVVRACFLETSTIGLRIEEQRRHVLARHAADGQLPLKRVHRPDGTVTSKAENDALVGDTLAARRRNRWEAEQ